MGKGPAEDTPAGLGTIENTPAPVARETASGRQVAKRAKSLGGVVNGEVHRESPADLVPWLGGGLASSARANATL